MASRRKLPMIQVFTVSWFPINTIEAMTLTCLSRVYAARIVDELTRDFAAYPGHDPLIHVDRNEVRADF